MRVSVAHEFLPKTNSVRAALVMDHFGIGFEQGRHVIADGLELPIEPGEVVLFTGASGSGKSSLMRGVVNALKDLSHNEEAHPAVLSIDELDLGTQPLIEALPCEPPEAMQLLSQCGLGESRLMLRAPSELSDGQRYRFRLALAVALKPRWVVADEFTATLDRTLAQVVAFNLRRLSTRTGIGFLLATTHEDVAADLDPDVHVCCRLDGAIEVQRKDGVTAETSEAADTGSVRKKKASASATNSGSAKRPNATGRISLGGITGAITSG